MSVGLVAGLAGALTLVLSVGLPIVVRPVLVKLGIMDVPNERSSHDRPVLRGLGLAVLIAMLVGGCLAIALSAVDSVESTGWLTLIVVVGASFASGLLGLAEDLRGVSVKVRSALLLLIALVTPVALLVAGDSPNLNLVSAVGAANTSDLPIWGVILFVIYAVLFLSSYINVANFMDGLNGISGFHGVSAGLAFACGGWFSGLSWLVTAGLVLAAGFLGFLPWNLTKPGAFLGDVGSYLLGGATAATSLAALLAGVPVLATIGPMVIYFGDVGVTLVKRVRQGKRWDEPHKEHVYQRIQQLGYSHVHAASITAGATLITSFLGLGSLFTGLFGTFALLIAGLAVLVFYLLLPRILPNRQAAPA